MRSFIKRWTDLQISNVHIEARIGWGAEVFAFLLRRRTCFRNRSQNLCWFEKCKCFFKKYNLKDLITYFPREHEDRGNVKLISEVLHGEEALISGFPIGRMNEIRIYEGNPKWLIRSESLIDEKILGN
mgnify:CR=1 FL=1